MKPFTHEFQASVNGRCGDTGVMPTRLNPQPTTPTEETT